MSYSFIDAHTHIQFKSCDADREGIILRAQEAGVAMINAGADVKTSKDAIILAHQYDTMWATIGIHPTETGTVEEVAEYARDEKVVGIGECGLEYFRLNNESKKEEQKKLFQKHIDLAHQVKKPLVIHCREAFADTIEMLKQNKEKLLSRPGALHFFTGTLSDAHELMSMGFYFTFGGLITFNRTFDEVIKIIPRENILLETDAPWVAPKSHRGQANEPSYITEIYEALANVWGASLEETRKKVVSNTQTLFGV